MPGPVYGTDRVADPPRDAWHAAGFLPDLRRRLERLPAGHPSSPYDGDGTRRPAPPRPRDFELPLPGEERGGNGAGSRERAARVTAQLAAAQVAADQAPDGGGPGGPEPPAGEVPEETGQDGEAELSMQPEPPADVKPPMQPEPPADVEVTAEHAPPDDPDVPGGGGTAGQAGTDGSLAATGLTQAQARVADAAAARLRAAEGSNVFGSYGQGGLTPAMRRIEARMEYGRLAPETDQYALKPAASFSEKLARLVADEPGADPADLAARIHDGVRYTFLIDEPSYSQGVMAVTAAIAEQGSELEARHNAWANPERRGISTRWRDPASGQPFEVQFHTHESWEASRATHEAYKNIVSAQTPVAERERLRAFQRQVAASVPIPPGALAIPEFRRDNVTVHG